MTASALHPARWSLRARLLGVLVGLLAVVCLALGVASTVALRTFLVGRLDTQLQSAGGRAVEAGGPGPGGPERGGARFVLAPGQAPGTLGARLQDGRVEAAAVLTEQGTLEQLPAGETAVLAALPAGSTPRTVDLPGRGSFRVLASTTADGDTLVTGLPLAPVDDTVVRLAVVEVLFSLAALLAAGLAAALIVRRTLEPLHRVATVATRVAGLPLERGEVELAARVPDRDTDPRTEVGQVGGALNRLLDSVGSALTARQASETRVRQFVADASHELRTPLAAIRGYAELTHRSSEPVPADVAYALGRVESEAQRMTALVEDLLLLARLDSGRPLDHEPVDLSRLVVDAVSDASAAGPDHVWRLDLPEHAVEVTGDAARLHQVLANLLANARTHTPPGSTVTAGLATSAGPGEVVLTVRDDGPGIPADLLPHVFSRFARGDGARTRGAGSTGLGLAIVEAIVSAHGGRVEVASRPGETAFRVRLPVGPAD